MNTPDQLSDVCGFMLLFDGPGSFIANLLLRCHRRKLSGFGQQRTSDRSKTVITGTPVIIS
jgi:hypothetical protein